MSPIGNWRRGTQQNISPANTSQELEQSRQWARRDQSNPPSPPPKPHTLPCPHDAHRNQVIPLRNPGMLLPSSFPAEEA